MVSGSIVSWSCALHADVIANRCLHRTSMQRALEFFRKGENMSIGIMEIAYPMSPISFRNVTDQHGFQFYRPFIVWLQSLRQ